MATLKKSARKSAAGKASKPTGKTRKASGASADRLLGRSITESAQQIWLAGMGAFTRAQAEGSRLFESLVRDGLSLEQSARRFASTRADVVRDAVEGTVGQARERAADTWDKLEKVFEERVQRALVRLGVPSREDLAALSERVERLTAQLRQGGSAAKPANSAKSAAAPRKRASAKTPAAKAAAAKPAAPRKRAAGTSTETGSSTAQA
ncbi:phasin family protein [Thermomonas flagellata]|uniref:phasin family protein n=1 Tax=Thermomonas flagellata TaxID=2888524 RepID=UPI001F047991|nr:phasin family protein [Thermomonas flagellata]